jgi:hypothetical protein
MGISDQYHVLIELYPWGKEPSYLLDRGLDGVPELVWMQRLGEKFFAPARDQNLVV